MKIKHWLILISSWLVPGLGHMVQKKTNRALIFFACISLMTLMGLLAGGRIYSFQLENPLTILAFFSDLGNGLFYFISRKIGLGLGDLKRTSYEFGTAFLAGAGLLNYLVALDALDIALGRKK